MTKIYRPNPDNDEPVRASGAVVAAGALVYAIAVRGLKLDPDTALSVSTLLGPILGAEIGRRFAFSPATVARFQAASGGKAVTGEPRKDPRWLKGYWPIYTALAALFVVVGFGGPEAVAVTNPGEGGTYTDWLRSALGTGTGEASWQWWAVTAGLTGFTVWMSGHLRGMWPWEKPLKST